MFLIFFLFGARVQVKVAIDAFHDTGAILIRVAYRFHTAGIGDDSLGVDPEGG
jgi:hypothetical protein